MLIAEHVKEPTVAGGSLNGGTIDQFSKIELTCETLGSKIFYTTDGSPPELHIESAKVCKTQEKACLITQSMGLKTLMCFIGKRLVRYLGFISKYWFPTDHIAIESEWEIIPTFIIWKLSRKEVKFA